MTVDERRAPTVPTDIAEGPVVGFRSILFDGSSRREDLDALKQPAYFPDLNLDQIVESITTGHEEYDLAPLFSGHVEDLETIHYRHEIFRDLEDATVLGYVTSFAGHMREMRKQLEQAATLRFVYQKQRCFVDVVTIYTDAVAGLSRDLASAEVSSRGLRAFRDYLASYVASPRFAVLTVDARELVDSLSNVAYTLHIKGERTTVRRYESEADYGAEVLRCFEKFRQEATKDYRVGFHNPLEMNHVEESVLGLVARLFPEEFAALESYFLRHADYLDDAIRSFDREVQFYVAYLEHIGRIKGAGLGFCYPVVSRESKEVLGSDTFDLALADKLVKKRLPVVTNDFYLRDGERIFVVSGPNQGGKTTFARAFGQLHHLAGLGCPVPGRDAQLFLFDKMFTHFDKEEDLTNLSGKLEDDLLRVRDILAEVTSDSIVVMNEIFSSTTLHDAIFLGKKVMERIVELDLLCVLVTFVDELASLGTSTVSMTSTVNADDPAERTYKVVRHPADGLAYAVAIAEKYGVTYERLRRRIGP
ncbi:MAG: MutS-related protein [Acidimicrobiales bacterium]